MGFLDFFKNLLGKKQESPSSPSEQGQGRVEPQGGQFVVPQNPAETQTPTSPVSPQTGQPENPTS